MNWLQYLLEANAYLAVAYGCYWLLFRKQTFYVANRVYLLLSTMICFVIPLVQLNVSEPQVAPLQQQQAIRFTGSYTHSALAPTIQQPLVTLNKAITTLYLTGVTLLCVLFAIKLYSLLKLILNNKRIKHPGYILIRVDQPPAPFSFFSFLFVSNKEHLQESILRHELVHIRQKHSWDIIFTELLKIINWFNPVIYLLQNSLKALHEYEADRLALITDKQPDSYVQVLIAQAYQTSGVPFVNHFSNQQLLKSRIMKLYQKRSGKLARLNYLLVVPLIAGLLCASSLAFSKDYGWINLSFNIQTDNNLHVKTLTNTTDKNLALKANNKTADQVTDTLTKSLAPPPPPAKPLHPPVVEKIPILPPPAKIRNQPPPPPPKIEAASVEKSFIESETLRFKNIASFTKPKPAAPGC